MSATKGNKFWEARSSHGRKPMFATPEDLWEACTEYFEWIVDNPLKKCEAFAYQGVVELKDIPLMRAMTIGGLCIFLDIARTTWDDYRARKDYYSVVNAIEEIIRDQKFSGAAAGLLNANIIARDLGLKDSTASEVSGPNGGPIDNKWTIEVLEIKR